MSFTHFSRKSWALIRRLGAAQQSPKTTHPPVSANAVAAHPIQVGQAPRNKKFERQICIQRRTLMRQAADKSLPPPFTVEEITAALQKTKPATVPVPETPGSQGSVLVVHIFPQDKCQHSIPKTLEEGEGNCRRITCETSSTSSQLSPSLPPQCLL